MKTLFLDFSVMYLVGLRLSGLSFKRIGNISQGPDLVKSDLGGYALSFRHLDGETSAPRINELCNALSEIYDEIPFERIKISGFYPSATAEELMTMIKQKAQK